MKKINVVLLIALALFVFNCKSPKKLQKVTGSEEVSVPLSGKDYETNKEYFRSKSSGKSIDLATAKKIALNNAKGEVAGLINTKIKAVTDNYTNQRTMSNTADFENKFENITREVVEQQLNDIAIIGEKIFRQKDGSLEYWVAIQISKDAIKNGINASLSNNAKVQIDYDKKKFEEIMNKEMSKENP